MSKLVLLCFGTALFFSATNCYTDQRKQGAFPGAAKTVSRSKEGVEAKGGQIHCPGGTTLVEKYQNVVLIWCWWDKLPKLHVPHLKVFNFKIVCFMEVSSSKAGQSCRSWTTPSTWTRSHWASESNGGQHLTATERRRSTRAGSKMSTSELGASPRLVHVATYRFALIAQLDKHLGVSTSPVFTVNVPMFVIQQMLPKN